jgi:hypothetical protein
MCGTPFSMCKMQITITTLLLDLVEIFIGRLVGKQDDTDILDVVRLRGRSVGAVSLRHRREELDPLAPLGVLDAVVERDAGGDYDGVDNDRPGRREAHDRDDEHDGRDAHGGGGGGTDGDPVRPQQVWVLDAQLDEGREDGEHPEPVEEVEEREDLLEAHEGEDHDPRRGAEDAERRRAVPRPAQCSDQHIFP